MHILLNCNVIHRTFLTYNLYTPFCHELLSSYLKQGNWMGQKKLRNVWFGNLEENECVKDLDMDWQMILTTL
jgi:hypothetical protein